MLACSTHGRVPSALRTRSGQPRGQFMAGTWKVTSVAGAGAACPAGAREPSSDRNKERIINASSKPQSTRRRRVPGHNRRGEALFADRLEHLLRAQLGRIVVDAQPVVV